MNEASRIIQKIDALYARIDDGKQVSAIEWHNVQSLWSLYIDRAMEKGEIF